MVAKAKREYPHEVDWEKVRKLMGEIYKDLERAIDKFVQDHPGWKFVFRSVGDSELIFNVWLQAKAFPGRSVIVADSEVKVKHITEEEANEFARFLAGFMKGRCNLRAKLVEPFVRHRTHTLKYVIRIINLSTFWKK